MKNRFVLPTSILAALALLVPSVLWGKVTLPCIFSNHMVLQKSSKVPVWGKAEPGEDVVVTLNGQTARAQTGADGKWKTTLDLGQSGPGPFVLTVEGLNRITIQDVLVGEVWVAGGQSNMEWTLSNTISAGEEIARSANPLLRQFKVQKAAASEPAEDCVGAWVAASPGSSGGFSAIGYYFAKALQKEIQAPLGILSVNYGGTHCEAWTSREALGAVSDFQPRMAHFDKVLREYPGSRRAFVEKMEAWLKETGREDKPCPDPSLYAGMDASTEGWIPVRVPGTLSAPGLPEAGAV